MCAPTSNFPSGNPLNAHQYPYADRVRLLNQACWFRRFRVPFEYDLSRLNPVARVACTELTSRCSASSAASRTRPASRAKSSTHTGQIASYHEDSTARK